MEQTWHLGKMLDSADGSPSPKSRAQDPAQLPDNRRTKRENPVRQRREGHWAAKRSKGHKRQVVVDSLGNLPYVKVHAANLSDTQSACGVVEGAAENYPSLKACSGDAGYRGTVVEFTATKLGMTLAISEKIEGKWAVLPKRWVVEQTFSWLGNFRRLSKDFEILPATAENMIRIAMLKITLAKCC